MISVRSKFLLWILCLMAFGINGKVQAQRFSYVYIQGDLKTPFYVKFEGEMLPRYGKNYCIISELAPGPIQIEVLFQQHAYPPASFAIQVPENGFRGFILTQQERRWRLYDIHQHFYLEPGNRWEDDRLPAPLRGRPEDMPLSPELASSPSHLSHSSREGGLLSASMDKIKALTPPIRDLVKSAPDSQKTKVVDQPGTPSTNPSSSATETTALRFLDDFELRGAATSSPSDATPEAEIYNSDCPRAISNRAFESLYQQTAQKPASHRLKFLFQHLEVCLDTDQARQLTLSLPTDAEKFTYLKRIYSRITNQSRFGDLGGLLEDPEWKSYFYQFIASP